MGDSSTEVESRISPPPDSAELLGRTGTASSIKRIQTNGMKPTIIEDSESDEDAIMSAKDNDEIEQNGDQVNLILFKY